MALSFAKVADAASVHGTVRETFYDVIFDSSYPTGGETISAKDLGLSQIYGLIFIGSSLVAGTAPTTRFVFTWDYKNNKIQAWGAAAGATGLTEAANTTNLSTYVLRVRAVGN